MGGLGSALGLQLMWVAGAGPTMDFGAGDLGLRHLRAAHSAAAGRSLYLRIDQSVKQNHIGKGAQAGKVLLPGGNTLFETGPDTVWGEEVPDVRLPEQAGRAWRSSALAGTRIPWHDPLVRAFPILPLLPAMLAAGLPSAYAVEPPESLRYDEAAWLCTHNAMNNAADGWRLPNQAKDLRGQFADGVRAFMLDVHVQDGALVLRHGPEAARLLGWRPLTEGLTVLRNLLEKNPRSVVTVILESYAPAADVAAAFAGAGLESLAHAQTAGKPWPTLGEMIGAGKRLVLFTDRPAGGPPWQMDVWRHAWETPFAARTPADLRNVPNRGRRDNALLILNHFCADPLPSRRLAAQVNADPFLAGRIAAARQAFGRKPNFLVVDFHDCGDGLAAVEALNREG